MTAIRCHMRVKEVIRSVGSHDETLREHITLESVFGKPGTANERSSMCAPSMEIEITNPEAFGKWRQSDHYFVDLVPIASGER